MQGGDGGSDEDADTVRARHTRSWRGVKASSALETFKRYVPHVVLRQLAAAGPGGAQAPQRPKLDSIAAAVLFVDISGFSKLSNMLKTRRQSVSIDPWGAAGEAMAAAAAGSGDGSGLNSNRGGSGDGGGGSGGGGSSGGGSGGGSGGNAGGATPLLSRAPPESNSNNGAGGGNDSAGGSAGDSLRASHRASRASSRRGSLVNLSAGSVSGGHGGGGNSGENTPPEVVAAVARARKGSLPSDLLMARIEGSGTGGPSVSSPSEPAVKLTEVGGVAGEDLRVVLNEYFDQLITIIQAHGGDVIKFAGDALLCLWTADGDDSSSSGSGSEHGGVALAEAVARAAQCSLTIHASMDNFIASKTDFRVRCKCMIGAGSVMGLSVGGLGGRWEFLVAGAPCTQVEQCSVAQPGEVLLSEAACRIVTQNPNLQAPLLEAEPADAVSDPLAEFGIVQFYRVLGMATAAPRPAALPEVVDTSEGLANALGSYVPSVVKVWHAAGQERWLSEIRKLSIVFVSLSGLELGDGGQAALDRVQKALLSAQRVLHRYEASLRQFLFEDKGATLIAASGLPPKSHEDDPHRAVRVAIDLRAKLNAMGVQASVGVSTGEVHCGNVGNATRCEYAMTGDAVILAARLMASAKGSILVDEPTHAATRRKVLYQDMGGIVLKGMGRTPAFKCLREIEEDVDDMGGTGMDDVGGAGIIKVREQPMIGRITERLVLSEKIHAMLRGTSSTMVIEGASGVGKSTLVREIGGIAAPLGVFVTEGHAQSTESRTPYFAWRPIMRALFGVDTSTMRSLRRASVLHDDTEASARVTGLIKAKVVTRLHVLQKWFDRCKRPNGTDSTAAAGESPGNSANANGAGGHALGFNASSRSLPLSPASIAEGVDEAEGELLLSGGSSVVRTVSHRGGMGRLRRFSFSGITDMQMFGEDPLTFAAEGGASQQQQRRRRRLSKQEQESQPHRFRSMSGSRSQLDAVDLDLSSSSNNLLDRSDLQRLLRASADAGAALSSPISNKGSPRPSHAAGNSFSGLQDTSPQHPTGQPGRELSSPVDRDPSTSAAARAPARRLRRRSMDMTMVQAAKRRHGTRQGSPVMGFEEDKAEASRWADELREKEIARGEESAMWHDLVALAPLLGMVLGVEWEDNSTTALLMGISRLKVMCDLCVFVIEHACTRPEDIAPAGDESLEAAAAAVCGDASPDSVDIAIGMRGPTVIVIDDVHWLDSASWALIQNICDFGSNVLMVLTTRTVNDMVPEAVRRNTRHLAGKSLMSMRLDVLSQSDIVKLISEMLGVSSVPLSLSDFVNEKSQGNPFFAQEIMMALARDGHVDVLDDECVFTMHSQHIVLPESVLSLVRSRIDSLHPSVQLILKMASVIGREFDSAALQRLQPSESAQDLSRMRHDIDRLVELNFLVRSDRQPGILEFRQHVVQEVAYSLLSYDARQKIHMAVAAWYMLTYYHDLSPVYSILAYHWGRASEPEKAVTFLELAGEQALLSCAMGEAVMFFSEALAMLTRDEYLQSNAHWMGPVQARWLRQLGEACLGTGKVSEAEFSLTKALTVCGAPMPPTRREVRRRVFWEWTRRRVTRVFDCLGMCAGGSFADGPGGYPKGKKGGSRVAPLSTAKSAQARADENRGQAILHTLGGMQLLQEVTADERGSTGFSNEGLSASATAAHLQEYFHIVRTESGGPLVLSGVGHAHSGGSRELRTTDTLDPGAIYAYETSHVHERLFEVYFFGADSDRALHSALVALRLTEQLGVRAARARCAANLSLVLVSHKHLHESARFKDQALRLLDLGPPSAATGADAVGASVTSAHSGSGDSNAGVGIGGQRRTLQDWDRARAWVYLVLGLRDFSLGNFGESRLECNVAVTVARQLNDYRIFEQALNTLAFVTFVHGSIERARELYQQVYGSGYRRGDVQTQSWGLLGMARASLAMGDLSGAVQLMETREQMLKRHVGRSAASSDINARALKCLLDLLVGWAPNPNAFDSNLAEIFAVLDSLESASGASIFMLVALNYLCVVLFTLCRDAAEESSPAQSQSSPAMAAGEAADVSGDGKGVGPQFEPEKGVAASVVTADASEASLPLRRISPAHGAQLLSAGARCVSLLKVFSRKFPTAKPRQALYEGMLASLGGNWAAARKSWARSLAEADALNWPYEKGLVAELMADSESAAGFEEHAARWAAASDQAFADFEALGGDFEGDPESVPASPSENGAAAKDGAMPSERAG